MSPSRIEWILLFLILEFAIWFNFVLQLNDFGYSPMTWLLLIAVVQLHNLVLFLSKNNLSSFNFIAWIDRSSTIDFFLLGSNWGIQINLFIARLMNILISFIFRVLNINYLLTLDLMQNSSFSTRLFNRIEYLKLKLISININYKYGKHSNLLKIVYFSLQSWWF